MLRRTLALFLVACGGTTSGGDAGPDGTVSDGNVPDVSTGCGSFTTTTYDADTSVCAPQLVSATSCQGAVCSFNVEIPCFGDAGAPDGGSLACVAWCNDAAPPGAQPVGFCQSTRLDGGGVVARCGGCGV